MTVYVGRYFYGCLAGSLGFMFQFPTNASAWSLGLRELGSFWTGSQLRDRIVPHWGTGLKVSLGSFVDSYTREQLTNVAEHFGVELSSGAVWAPFLTGWFSVTSCWGSDTGTPPHPRTPTPGQSPWTVFENSAACGWSGSTVGFWATKTVTDSAAWIGDGAWGKGPGPPEKLRCSAKLREAELHQQQL